MNFLDHAKRLASLGFEVFPIQPGDKLPAIPEFPEAASCDPKQLEAFWLDDVMGIIQPYNVGISTSRFKGGGLLVIDVDNKGEKKGSDELVRLELSGCEFPDTLTQRTPTGGLHLVYKVAKAVKQGVNVLAHGLDIRSKGGYIVAAGSVVEAGEYTIDIKRIADAPQWLIDKCEETRSEPTKLVTATALTAKVDQATALQRAEYYLTHKAPVAIEGAAGDQTTFKVCCVMKDMGLSQPNAFTALWEHWNPNCSPPWSAEELKRKITNAYAYGQSSFASDAPESHFTPVEPEIVEEDTHPFDKLNSEYAFVLSGGQSHILWETKGSHGEDKLIHLTEVAFHKKFAAETLRIGTGKAHPLTELWMKHPNRRSYDGICFMPGKQAPPRFYNLWRGFSVELPEGEPNTEALWALDAFFEHALKNVCDNDPELFKWLVGYFAHLIQKPSEKPLTALVFRGRKGVGKNVLVDQIAALIRSNTLVTSNRRYLIGNFNSHLENLLMLVLDEAFWSGDKQMEGILKDLITGHHHVIEHKGQEAYKVDNCTRVIIIGNEDWVVPASEDERRFAVFTVGDGRKQDRAFFTRMRKGMESGGHSLLLKHLMEFDLESVDINDAPKTTGLLDQKLESMSAFNQWLFACLNSGRVVGLDFSAEWPREIECEQFRLSMIAYAKNRNIRSWNPDERVFGKSLKQVFPQIGRGRKTEGDRPYTYVLPSLEVARNDWQKFIGQKIKWDFNPSEEDLKSMLE